MHAGEHGCAIADVAFNECEVLDAVDGALVCNAGEAAPFGWHCCRANALYKSFVMSAVFHKVGNGGEQQVVFGTEFAQVGQTRHGAVVVLNFANDSCRLQAGKASEIDCGFGVAGALEHAAFAGAEREDVAWAGECRVGDLWVGKCAKRCCAIGCRDACGGALQ